ncbi:GNAT family N-acetyltransferase [Nocardioides sp. zg-DK7169]|uniref:GNAT family N-acetyltransferase n=1 Tax=Nocardioides sp. zg-DK7169 TaxID=2736600 RepID=UPI001C12D1C2|nr:GNAT family N-acetyltransferase [Nocardioides sp. zg-DK7169]
MDAFTVRAGTVDEALRVEAGIPEFGGARSPEQYAQRLAGTPHLVLVAESGGELVGYKVGYEERPEIFYSWLGGVVPAWRRRGVAAALRVAQEQWARDRGYRSVEVKTMNRFPAMLHLLVAAGYRVVGVEGRDEAAKIRFARPLADRIGEG